MTEGTRGRSLTGTTLAAVYVGTVVGAGFASGQEVLQFFVLHGVRGLGALAVATAALAWFGYLLMAAGQRLRATSYGPVFAYVSGPVLGRVVDGAVSLFLFGGCAAMFAGAGATVREQYGLPFAVGLVFMAAFTVGTVLLGIAGVVSSLKAVVPVLLVGVLGISIGTLVLNGVELGRYAAREPPVRHWFVAGVTYGS